MNYRDFIKNLKLEAPKMITKENAEQFAHDWIDSWNSYDLDRVMSHYHEDVEYFSTFAAKLSGNTSGKLNGKDNVRNYLQKGLDAYPDLHFVLENVFIGIASITLQYKSVNNLLAAEVFELNEQALVMRVQCHYKELTSSE